MTQQPIQHDLPRDSTAPAAARQWLDEVCRLPQDRRDDALLLVSEVVSNAVRHGSGDIAIEAECGASIVKIAVSDSGGGLPAPLFTGGAPDRAFGRGLQLVDRLADRWGFTVGATTRVWFELWLVDDIEGSVFFGPGAVLESVASLVERPDSEEVVVMLVETLAIGMGFSSVRFEPRAADLGVGAVRAAIRHGGQREFPPRPDEQEVASAVAALRSDPVATLYPSRSDVAPMLVVPVRAAASDLGALVCIGAEDVPLDEVDRAVVSASAAQLAQLLEKRRVAEAQQTLVGALGFLAEASRVLASSLDYEETIQGVARLVVPARADWCTVNLVEPSGIIRRVAAEHADPAAYPSLIELLDQHPHDPEADSGVPRVIRSGEPLLFEEVPEQLLEETAHNPEYLEITKKLQIRSCVIVPIEAHGRILGTMSLVSADPDRLRYGTADLALFEDLGRRVGVAIENARLYTDNTSIARALQRALLPDGLPAIPGFELAARYVPAATTTDVGGDFYDVIGAGDGGWHIFVGDVQGKGPEAATLLGLARHTIRSASLRGEAPAASLLALNDALLASRSDRLCTAVLASIRNEAGRPRLRLARAGHPPPFLLRADGTIERLEPDGILLGAYVAAKLKEYETMLDVGDRLVLYTDGAYGEDVDEARLLAALEGIPAGSADDLARHVLDISEHGGPRSDDFTVVVVAATG